MSFTSLSLAPLCCAQSALGTWVDSWTASPVSASPSAAGLPVSPDLKAEVTPEIGAATLRETERLSLGGDQLRLVISNEFGTDPLVLDSVDVGLPEEGGGIEPSSLRAVNFHESTGVIIPPGAMMLSDPIDLKLPSLAMVTIELHLPAQQMHTASWHSFANQSNSVLPVEPASAVKVTACWTFLKGIQVKTQAAGRTIVAFGDSITDGVHSTKSGNARWPDVLAERLAKASAKNISLRGLGVANEGIGGNRILENAAGPDGLARFDRDVLAQPNVRYLILFEGINDIGNMPVSGDSKLLAARMMGGYEQMIERAHAHGILVYGATLTPYEGAAYATFAGEAVRRQVNEWIRSSRAFDAVLDFDRVTRDPDHPSRLLPAYDPGDHLHPNDAGYRAIAESIDLTLFHQKQTR